MVPKGLPARDTPMIHTEGLFADCGRRSFGGDSINSSSMVIEVDDSLLLPAPKRNAGN